MINLVRTDSQRERVCVKVGGGSARGVRQVTSGKRHRSSPAPGSITPSPTCRPGARQNSLFSLSTVFSPDESSSGRRRSGVAFLHADVLLHALRLRQQLVAHSLRRVKTQVRHNDTTACCNAVCAMNYVRRGAEFVAQVVNESSDRLGAPVWTPSNAQSLTFVSPLEALCLCVA